MHQRSVSLALCAAALLIPVLSAAQSKTTPILEPGMKAPALSIKQWFKGTPITEVNQGVVVVEFWATWCGPCVEVIPHVTELAKQHTDVTFLGVSVWEADPKSITEFVAKMGPKMDYRVAWTGENEGMAKTWLEPAAQNGIPCSFILKDGVVQWIGHPSNLDSVIPQVKSGTFDLAAHRTSFRKEAAAVRLEMATYAEIEELEKMRGAGKKKEAAARLAKFLRANPKVGPSFELSQLLWLAEDTPNAWPARAKVIQARKTDESRQLLCQFAVRSVTAEKGNRKLGRQAMELVLKGPNGDTEASWSYAAFVYGRLDDKAQALKANRRLLELTPNKPENKERRAAIQERIKALGG